MTAHPTAPIAAAGLRRRSWPWLMPWIFLAPGLVLTGGMILVPLIAGVTYAFRDLSMNNPFVEGDFIGFANFEHVLGDPRLPRVVANTLWWTLVTLLLQFLLGLSLALMLNGAAALFGGCSRFSSCPGRSPRFWSACSSSS